MLRNVWPAAFIVAALGCLGIWGVAVLADRRGVVEAASRHMAATARLLEEHADRAFEAGDRVVQAAVEASDDGAALQDPARAQALHGQLIRLIQGNPQIASVWVMDAAGLNVAENWSHPPRSTGPFRDRDYFQAHLRGETGLHIGPTGLGSSINRARFTLSRPVLGPDGGLAGVVASGVFSDYFANIYAEAGLSPGSVFALVRRSGEPLAIWPSEPGRAPPPEVLARAAAGGDRTEVLRGPDGRESLVATRALDRYPASLLVTQPLDEVLAPWRQRTWMSGTAVAVVLAALAGLTLLGLRGTLRERALRRHLEEERALLERRVTERTSALAGSEARLRLAMRAGGLALLWYEPAGASLGWSAELASATGLPLPGSQAPLDDFLGLVHPDDREALAEALRRAVAEGGDLRIEFRLLQPDGGGLRWLDWRAAPVAGAAGEAPRRIEGVAADVSTRKEAEQRQLLLTREVQHRAKNALAVVQATLRLTRAESSAEYSRLVQGRIAALARAHTMLAEGDWTGTDLRALLEGELAPFLAGEEAGGRVDLSGPPLDLQPGAAQPLTMAVHELATNAVKHGALSAPDGRLRVAWTVEDCGRWLRLAWTESGGPPLTGEPPQRRGFGSRVMQATVEQQLGGRWVQDWRAEGLAVEMRIPLGHGQAERLQAASAAG